MADPGEEVPDRPAAPMRAGPSDEAAEHLRKLRSAEDTGHRIVRQKEPITLSAGLLRKVVVVGQQVGKRREASGPLDDLSTKGERGAERKGHALCRVRGHDRWGEGGVDRPCFKSGGEALRTLPSV